MKNIISLALVALTATTMAIVTGCDKKDDPAAPKISDAPKIPDAPKTPDAPKMPAAPKDHPAH